MDDKPIIPNSPDSQITSISAKKSYDKKVHGKRYSVATKLAIKALQGSGISVEEASSLTDAHRQTIVRIWDDKELDDLSPSVVNKVKIGLGGLFYKRALGATLAISDQKLSESSALQLATVAGIMTEKGRLMEGLSTENLSFRGIAQSIESDREKIMKRIEEIEGNRT